MGKHFGNLQKLKGINYYYLSPYEQKPFKGFIGTELLHVFRKIRENFLFVAIPGTLFYTIYDQSLKIYRDMNRKNPDDFKDDE